MKAIIISDEANVISKLDSTLIAAGFDTIIYRWLLKALDNIEEIRPDLVIVSASEYPRHWKTLTQFIASGIGGDKTKVFLFTLNSLSAEETQKAEALGIKGFIEGVDDNSLENLNSLLSSVFNLEAPLPAPVPSYDEAEDDYIPTVEGLQESCKIEFDSDSVSLVFANPKTGKMITGSVVSYENKTVHFKPDYPEKTAMLSSGDVIETLTFEMDNKVCSYKAEIIMNNDAILMKLEETHGQA